METEAEKRTRMTHKPLQHQRLQESQRGIHTTNMLRGFLTQLPHTKPSVDSGNDLNNKNGLEAVLYSFHFPCFELRNKRVKKMIELTFERFSSLISVLHATTPRGKQS